MAIKIKRNDAGNCIEFQGSSNPVYWNACLSGEVDSTDVTLVNVINDIKTSQTGINQYEFFRIPYTEFIDEDGLVFNDAQEVADYITLKGNVSAPDDINVGYKGVFDASTSADPTDASPVNGDWYYVGTEGTINTVEYKVNDIIKYSETTLAWERIENKNATVQELEDSALDQYDIHVDGGYTGTIRNGSSIYPYNDLSVAIAASNEGDTILIKGDIEVPNSSSDAFVLPHSLHFYGADESEIRFTTYDYLNGDLFYFQGTDNSQNFSFKNLVLKNAGGYALHIKKTSKVVVEDCTLENNGWNGLSLNTVLPSSVSGLLGYDSTNTDLQAFYAGVNASNGGATRIEEATQLLIVGNTVTKNLRGIRVSDCGVNGGGVISRNQSTQNIESGIYLSVGSLGGCQNVTVMMNVSSYNANNGLLAIGGLNNKFSQNEVNGNWNAGFCAWGSANATLRDCGLYDNNRSTYNGIGNTGDAKASIQINDAYNLLGTQITYNPAFRFIAEILDTQVHYTGLGSNTEKIGFLITSAVGNLSDNSKNIIKVDDVGFIGQDYAIDLSEVDVTNLRLSLGDNSYQSIGLKAVKAPLAGNYSELPFSNHVMEVPEVDIVVDTLKQTIALHEGVGGNVINVYSINELQSVLKTNSVDIIQKSSDKIQLRDLTLGNVYINGVVAGSNINTMNDSLNAAFSMDLTEYKEFIETEVGVVGGGNNQATFYYIESPDGTYHYPLFKTEAEANQVDTDLGGSGSSHTHTYVDDLTNTTWYMPDVSNHMNSSVMPVNGLYTAPNGGEVENVTWNIQVTDTDSNYTPTFTDLTFTIAEGSAANLVYKPAGDTDTYNVTGVPTGYADTGYAIVGTAETITDGIDIVHTLNVTKANAFGSDTGTITFTVTDDPSNNASSNSTSWTKAVHFGSGGGYSAASHLRQAHNHQDFNILRHNGLSVTAPLPDQAGMMSRSVSARPWATSVVFKSDGNNVNQHIWQQGNGSGGNGNHIYLRLNSIGKLYFGWGKTGVGVNECLIATGINTSDWYGVYIASNGARLAGGTNQYASPAQAADVNLAASFDIRLMSSADNFSSLSSNLSTASNWVSTGQQMSESTTGVFHIGSANGQKYFYGKVASMLITALRITEYANTQIPMPSDAEIKLMITDPKGWEDDYRDGELVRVYTGVTTGTYNPAGYEHGYLSNFTWLMGDGTLDGFSSGIRNDINPTSDSGITKMVFNNMSASDIVNVSISGLS
jgi:hypothetical protein